MILAAVATAQMADGVIKNTYTWVLSHCKVYSRAEAKNYIFLPSIHLIDQADVSPEITCSS